MSAARQTPPARPEPGTRVQFRWRKWDGSPHWVHDCVYLGHDRWGDWFGQRAGWRSTRPERDYLVDGPNVTLHAAERPVCADGEPRTPRHLPDLHRPRLGSALGRARWAARTDRHRHGPRRRQRRRRPRHLDRRPRRVGRAPRGLRLPARDRREARDSRGRPRRAASAPASPRSTTRRPMRGSTAWLPSNWPSRELDA